MKKTPKPMKRIAPPGLTLTQSAVLVDYMTRMALADYEHDGDFSETRLAEYALIEYGDEMHLDDGELAPIWELALRAGDRADKLIAKSEV